MMRQLWICILLLFGLNSYSADDLLSLERSGESKLASSYKAKKEIQDKLVLDLGRELVVQLIGEEEFKRKQAGVDRVLRNHFGKFIPYMKAGKMKKTSSGFAQSISFQVSMSSLRDVLSQEGLLYEKVKNVKILPVISYLDSFEAKSFKWWYSKEPMKHSFLWSLFQKSQVELRDQLWQEGFYLQNPISHEYAQFLGPDFKVEAHRKADMIAMAKDLGADLVIYGGLRVGVSDENSRVSTVKLSLKALLVNNLRSVAEVSLSWNTQPGDYKSKVLKGFGKELKSAITELTAQVKDAYQKGKFGTQSMELILVGSLNYQEFQKLKQNIRLSNYQIKSLKERRLENGRFTLELDVSGEREKLIKHFESWKLEDWDMSLRSANVDRVEMRFGRK